MFCVCDPAGLYINGSIVICCDLHIKANRNITGMGVVTNGKITLEKVNYVEQLKHNLMSVSQICDKGNSVLLLGHLSVTSRSSL